MSSKLKGLHKALRYHTFIAECRAYGQIVRNGKNGHFLAHCHGWIKIPQRVTKKVACDLARRGSVLEQPLSTDGRLRGILFDYIEGNDLSGTAVDTKSIAKIKRCVAALHDCGVTHGDLNPSNIRLTKEGRVFLLDLGSSMTFPHPTFCENKTREQEEFGKRKDIDWSDLTRITKSTRDTEVEETYQHAE